MRTFYSVSVGGISWSKFSLDLPKSAGKDQRALIRDAYRVKFFGKSNSVALFSSVLDSFIYLHSNMERGGVMLETVQLIRAYFVSQKIRFDAVILQDILSDGGMDISKSFARAFLSDKQLAKYKRPVGRDHLKAFVIGLCGGSESTEKKLIVELLTCNDFESAINAYKKLLSK